VINSKNYNEIAPQTLAGWLADGRAFFLIDTHPGDRFHQVHLPRAVNACVYEVTFVEQVRAVTADKSAAIVLYGSSLRSLAAMTAAEKLDREGYRHLHVLQGGLAAWRAAGLALEGTAVDAPDDPQTLVQLEDRVYQVDLARSSIQWTGRNANSTHFGTVALSKGTLAVEDGALHGAFDIDMRSIANINLAGDALQPVLLAHLHSDDFFLTSLFPRARFEILDAALAPAPFVTAPNCQIAGALQLRGVKAQLDFEATLTRTAANGLAVEAHFDLDRTRWGVIYGSARFFEHLGMHLVFDLISFQVRIMAE